MTVHKKTITIPSKEETRAIGVQCDCCGEYYPGAHDDWSDGINWLAHDERSMTAIRFTSGYDCPDGGSRKGISYHICPKCFSEKVIPLLDTICKQTPVGEDW